MCAGWFGVGRCWLGVDFLFRRPAQPSNKHQMNILVPSSRIELSRILCDAYVPPSDCFPTCRLCTAYV